MSNKKMPHELYTDIFQCMLYTNELTEWLGKNSKYYPHLRMMKETWERTLSYAGEELGAQSNDIQWANDGRYIEGQEDMFGSGCDGGFCE